jgi:hypothetical protein
VWRHFQLCIFEKSDRVGGRTLSVRMEGTPFVVDLGAYRFAPDMHLPGDLIMRDLQLATECYEPHCPDPSVDFHAPMVFNYTQPLRRIVDPGACAYDPRGLRLQATGYTLVYRIIKLGTTALPCPLATRGAAVKGTRREKQHLSARRFVNESNLHTLGCRLGPVPCI